MADIALATDPDVTRLQIQRLVTQDQSRSGEGAFVRFEGRTLPTGFRGEGIGNEWNLEAIYGRRDHVDALSLHQLLDYAFQAADGRLILRTAGGQVSGMNSEEFIEVHSWNTARQPGGVLRVAFTATQVWDAEIGNPIATNVTEYGGY